MKRLLPLLASTALLWATAQQATAQDSDRPVTPRDVLAGDEHSEPAPSNSDIIVQFQDTRQIYFKQPIKSIAIDDPMTVRAIPKSDHVIAFTGLSPGRTTIRITGTDGTIRDWGFATTVREPHEVHIYVPSSNPPAQGNALVNIQNNYGGEQAGQATVQPDYKSVLCNEVRCITPPPPPSQR